MKYSRAIFAKEIQTQKDILPHAGPVAIFIVITSMDYG
jgi:hypothetical protein